MDVQLKQFGLHWGGFFFGKLTTTTMTMTCFLLKQCRKRKP